MRRFRAVYGGRSVEFVCKRHDRVCGNHAEVYRKIQLVGNDYYGNGRRNGQYDVERLVNELFHADGTE